MRAILILLDGLRPDLVCRMPRLNALSAAGTRFTNARSVFPSETRVATSSLVTGCRPAAHGLTANTIFDAALAPERLLKTSTVADLRLLAAGKPSPLQRPGLGEILAAAGRRFAVVSAGSPGQTFLAHPRAEALGGFRWNVADTAGAAARWLAKRLGPAPAATIPNIPRLEYAVRAMTSVVLPELCPDITLLWLPEPDISFHYRGLDAPETRMALAAADAAVGQVLDWRAAQPDRAEIALFVLSDHGHVSGNLKLDLAAELRRGGFAAAAGLAPGVDVVVAPAAAPGLWLSKPGLAPALAEFLAAQAWAGPLLVRNPALLPSALPLAYLDAAHRRSADMVLCFAGDDGLDHYGLPGRAAFDTPDVPEGGGMHGGLHRRELATVLIAEGGPFRRGVAVQAACDLADIAPTLLHLLGLPAEGMDGRVLAEGWAGTDDAPPVTEMLMLPHGFRLEMSRQGRRRYPTALTRA